MAGLDAVSEGNYRYYSCCRHLFQADVRTRWDKVAMSSRLAQETKADATLQPMLSYLALMYGYNHLLRQKS